MLKFLVDTSPATLSLKTSSLIAGQLLTPLTRYKNWGGVYGIDNGAYSGFPEKDFISLLERDAGMMHNCLFVTVPDIVGNCRRTIEIFKHRNLWIPSNLPVALVAQNGIEECEIPWDELNCLFIGGIDPWKDSNAVADLVKTAKILKKHVHVGRVNTIKRFRRFMELGADTCDGSGIAMYDHMLRNIESELSGSNVSIFDFFKDEGGMPSEARN